MMDLTKMSIADLEWLEKESKKLRKQKAKEEAAARRLREYKLEEYVPEYDFSLSMFQQAVRKYFESIDRTDIYVMLINQSTRRKDVDYSEVLTCPECGQAHLSTPCETDELGGCSAYRVQCWSCNFSFMPKDKDDRWYPSDVWDQFIKWLVANGYLYENSLKDHLDRCLEKHKK